MVGSLPVLNLTEAKFECTYGRGCEGICCQVILLKSDRACGFRRLFACAQSREALSQQRCKLRVM